MAGKSTRPASRSRTRISSSSSSSSVEHQVDGRPRVRAARPGAAGDHGERARGAAQLLARGAQARDAVPDVGAERVGLLDGPVVRVPHAVARTRTRAGSRIRGQEGSAKWRPPMSSTTGSPSRAATVSGSSGSRVGERRGRDRAAAERARERQHRVGQELHAAQRRGQLARLRVRRHRARRHRAQVAERERRDVRDRRGPAGRPRRR